MVLTQDKAGESGTKRASPFPSFTSQNPPQLPVSYMFFQKYPRQVFQCKYYLKQKQKAILLPPRVPQLTVLLTRPSRYKFNLLPLNNPVLSHHTMTWDLLSQWVLNTQRGWILRLLLVLAAMPQQTAPSSLSHVQEMSERGCP